MDVKRKQKSEAGVTRTALFTGSELWMVCCFDVVIIVVPVGPAVTCKW